MMKRKITFRARTRTREDYPYGVKWMFFSLKQIISFAYVYAELKNDIEWNTLTEYTGLLDKNGKEIYEGDICELGWSEKKWRVISNYAQFDFQCNTMQRPLNDHDPAEIEIIDNIYENPELLRT